MWLIYTSYLYSSEPLRNWLKAITVSWVVTSRHSEVFKIMWNDRCHGEISIEEGFIAKGYSNIYVKDTISTIVIDCSEILYTVY